MTSQTPTKATGESGCVVGNGMAICFGTGRRFVARVHRRGARKWDIVGRPSKSSRVAILRMAKAFADDRHNFYNRADVIMTADWYDPVQICELVNR